MKLVLKNTDTIAHERLSIRQQDKPCMDACWHYHPQYELLYVCKGSGIRFVGDSVSPFSPGDLVLVGPYLPHLWRNEMSYYQQAGTQQVKTVILKFLKNFVGEDTFDNPAFLEVNNLLNQSKYGISFGMEVALDLHRELTQMVDASPAEQAISLLGILWKLSETQDKQVLSSTDMRQYTFENSQRIDTVLKFISDNYASYICLKDVADVACMTTNSFCRFFKKMTNKSFTRFLNELRVRNASRLLVQEEDLSVSEVCYMVGYQSITNFNRQFKRIMGATPNNYRHNL